MCKCTIFEGFAPNPKPLYQALANPPVQQLCCSRGVMPHVLPSPVAVCTMRQVAAITTVNAQPAQHAKRESLYG